MRVHVYVYVYVYEKLYDIVLTKGMKYFSLKYLMYYYLMYYYYDQYVNMKITMITMVCLLIYLCEALLYNNYLNYYKSKLTLVV